MERDNRIPSPAPIFFAMAAFCVAWFDLFIPLPRSELLSAAWCLESIAISLFRVAVMLLAMRLWLGVAAFGLGVSRAAPRAADLTGALVAAAAAAAVAVAAAVVALPLGAANPLFGRRAPAFAAGPAGIVPFLLPLVSLGVGYSEELYFRFFAPKALERAGFRYPSAALLVSMLFGLSHGSQGALGMATAFGLALVFAWLKHKGKNLHALALGHALYDVILLYALRF